MGTLVTTSSSHNNGEGGSVVTNDPIIFRVLESLRDQIAGARSFDSCNKYMIGSLGITIRL